MKTTVSFSVWKKLKAISEDGKERRIEQKIVFNKFMRDGKCREEYDQVHQCVMQFQHDNELRKSKCASVYLALTKCCVTHKDYYWPILERDMQVKEDFFEQLRIKHRKEREKFFEELKRD